MEGSPGDLNNREKRRSELKKKTGIDFDLKVHYVVFGSKLSEEKDLH